MKNKLVKTILGASLIAGLVALDNIKTNEKGCETYRGYSNFAGERIYVFDSRPVLSRGRRSPKYTAFGDNSLRDSLKIGEKYCFETEKSMLPGSKERIKSVTPYRVYFAEQSH